MSFNYFKYNTLYKITLYFCSFLFLWLSWLTLYNELKYQGEFYPLLLVLMLTMLVIFNIKIEIKKSATPLIIALTLFGITLKKYQVQNWDYIKLKGGLKCISVTDERYKIHILEGHPDDMLILKSILSL